jgi:hypothetical protein
MSIHLGLVGAVALACIAAAGVWAALGFVPPSFFLLF